MSVWYGKMVSISNDGTKVLGNNFLKCLKSFQGNIDFDINSKKNLMDWQTNKGKPSDIDPDIKEIPLEVLKGLTVFLRLR